MWSLALRAVILIVIVYLACSTFVTILFKYHVSGIIIDLWVNGGRSRLTLASLCGVRFLMNSILILSTCCEVFGLIEHRNSWVIIFRSIVFAFLWHLCFDLSDIVVIRVGIHRINREWLHTIHLIHIVRKVWIQHLWTVSVHHLFTKLQDSLFPLMEMLGRYWVMLLCKMLLLLQFLTLIFDLPVCIAISCNADRWLTLGSKFPIWFNGAILVMMTLYWSSRMLNVISKHRQLLTFQRLQPDRFNSWLLIVIIDIRLLGNKLLILLRLMSLADFDWMNRLLHRLRRLILDHKKGWMCHFRPYRIAVCLDCVFRSLDGFVSINFGHSSIHWCICAYAWHINCISWAMTSYRRHSVLHRDGSIVM